MITALASGAQNYGPAAFAAVVVVGAVMTWLQTRAPLKQAETEGMKAEQTGEALLRADLMRMIGELGGKLDAAERRHDEQTKECDERIRRMEERHSAQITAVTADIKTFRHERNNFRQGFNYLIMRIKAHGDPSLAQIAAEAEGMIARGDELIAIENGAGMRARTG